MLKEKIINESGNEYRISYEPNGAHVNLPPTLPNDRRR